MKKNIFLFFKKNKNILIHNFKLLGILVLLQLLQIFNTGLLIRILYKIKLLVLRIISFTLVVKINGAEDVKTQRLPGHFKIL